MCDKLGVTQTRTQLVTYAPTPAPTPGTTARLSTWQAPLLSCPRMARWRMRASKHSVVVVCMPWERNDAESTRTTSQVACWSQ